MKDFFYRNPWVRTIFPLLLLTIASITANTLVVEITKNNSIDWWGIPDKASFYILLISTILTAIYQVNLFKFDTALLKGITPKQYESALRKQALEASSILVNKLIQEGDLENLRRTTTAFKEIFGEGE